MEAVHNPFVDAPESPPMPKVAPLRQEVDGAQVDGVDAEVLDAVVKTREGDENAVADYDHIMAQVEYLRRVISGMSFDCADRKQDQEARSYRAKFRSLKARLEETRKEIKAPVLERERRIDAYAKTLKDRIDAIVEPIDSAIVAEEQRLEREREEAARRERDRQADHERALAKINEVLIGHRLKCSAELQAVLNDLREHSPLEARDWQEYLPQAQDAIRNVTAALEELISIAKDREELAVIRAQNEADLRARAAAEAAERAKQERLGQIRGQIRAIEDTPGLCIGMGSGFIRKRIEMLDILKFADFGDLAAEAERAYTTSRAKLDEMLAAVDEAEAQAAELERLRAAEAERKRIEEARVAKERADALEAEETERRRLASLEEQFWAGFRALEPAIIKELRQLAAARDVSDMAAENDSVDRLVEIEGKISFLPGFAACFPDIAKL